MSYSYDILLCDLDAFFASVEQRDNPKLKGKPIIIGGDPDYRGVVSTCSYEARQYGIRAALPTKKALQLCPKALLLPARMPRYKKVSLQVMDILERFTPDIERVSIDEAYLAVKRGTGLETARRIRFAVKKELNLPLSIGVSVNKLLSKIACSLAKPDNIKALWPHAVEKSLWPLSIGVLPGVGPVTEKKLNKFGIKTVADLAFFPGDALKNIVGNYAADLKEYSWGYDNRKLELKHKQKSISEEITFPRDIYDQEIIMDILFDLAAELGYRLRSKGLRARTIALKLKFPDLTIKTKTTSFPEAIDDDEKIYDTATTLFNHCCSKPPWRLIGISTSGLQKWEQLALFSAESQKKDKIKPVLDLLRQKYGKNAIFKGRRLLLLLKKDALMISSKQNK
jgi:DNA polymerase-4